MSRILWCVALSASLSHGYSNHATTVGKTHFVVGMPQSGYTQYQEQVEPVDNQSNVVYKILFAPDDDIHAELMQLIQNETRSIKVAMYLLTDQGIAKALHDAMRRGVSIECVTDATCLSNKSNKVDMLAQAGVPVWVYRTANGDKNTVGNLMHHKFLVLSSSCKVVTGSLNITHSAQKSNQENVVVLSGEHAVWKFDTQFEKLKTRCSRLTTQK